MAYVAEGGISYNAPLYSKKITTATFTGNQALASRPVASGGTHTPLIVQRIGGLQFWSITDVAFQFTNSTARIPFVGRFQVLGGTATNNSGVLNGMDPTVNYEIGDTDTWWNVFGITKNGDNDFNITLVTPAGAAGRVFNIIFSTYPGVPHKMYYLSGGDVPLANNNPSIEVSIDNYRYTLT